MLGEKLKERFGDRVVSMEAIHGRETVLIKADGAVDFFRTLRDDPEFKFEFLMDLFAIDWLERKPRFDVVYNLKSMSLGHRLFVKIQVEFPDPQVASVIDVWKSADWLERETYDMMGIQFDGHPDLRRILLYDTFVGHPLRKDYPFQKRQPLVSETDPIAHPLRPSK